VEAGRVLADGAPRAGLAERRPAAGRWVWRCHIDISAPQRRVWSFLRRYVSRYDAAVFSLPRFAPQLSIPQYLVYPSIDPLADKNRRLTRQEVGAIPEGPQIPRDKPIGLQVSPLAHLADPVGALHALP